MIQKRPVYRILVSLFITTPAFAEAAKEYSVNELFDLDLKTLISLPITSASRKEETVARTAGAVTVITAEDIQRSGFLTLPEILRLVPGLYVGRVDSHKFWVSLRGFGSRFNNKLQVMIDDRKLYSQLFSGTYFEQQMPFLADIERIEVIRGSGGTLWGSNAMNGVINIVTRNSRETTDGLASVAVGDEELKQFTAIRQGWEKENFTGRVYAQEYVHDDGQLTDNTQVENAGLTPGSPADDEWRFKMGGFRMDWQFDTVGQTLSLQGESYDGHFDQTRLTGFGGNIATEDTLNTTGQFLLVNYKQPIDQKQNLSFVGYIDEYDRRDASFSEDRQAIDGNLQYDLSWAENVFIMGWDQQRSADDTGQVSTLYLDPADKVLDTTGIYTQNTFNFMEYKLALTAGIRFDKNEYTDWENQPTLKAYYELTPIHHVWASWAKSVTTPGRIDTESYLSIGSSDFRIGNPDIKPEHLEASEIGYRYTTNGLDIDLSVYQNHYTQIAQTVNPAGQSNNGQSTDINGFEIAVRKQWIKSLGTQLQYAHADLDYTRKSSLSIGNNAVSHLASTQINWQMRENLQANLGVYYNSNPDPEINNNIYQSNTLVELNFQYQLRPDLRLTLAGQNLLDDATSEAADSTRLNSGVERAYYVKADFRW